MKKAFLTLAVATAFILGTGMASASTTFWTDISTNGEVSIDNYGHENVAFNNEVDINSGTLNFDQDIDTYYGDFSNDVRLRESDVSFKNSAGEGQIAGHWVRK